MTSRSQRRVRGVAAISLAATAGLLGTYLGNHRTPRAYAQPGAPFQEFFSPSVAMPATGDGSPGRAKARIDGLRDSAPALSPQAPPVCTTSVATAGALRTAVSTASDGDVICITDDILNLRQEMVITGTSLTLIGAAGADSLNPVTIRAAGNRHLRATLDDASDSLMLENIVFAGGSRPTAPGGSLHLTGPGPGGPGGTVIMSGVTFTDNSAIRGGAIYATNFDEIGVVNSAFTGNEASLAGGAIEVKDVRQLAVISSALTENDGGSVGGAITASAVAAPSIVGLVSSAVTDNTAAVRGGGIAMQGAGQSVRVIAYGDPAAPGVFTGNSAGEGGAVDVYEIGATSSAMVMALGQVEFSDNRATFADGGAVRVAVDEQAPVGPDAEPNFLAFGEEGPAVQFFEGVPRFTRNSAVGSGGAVRVDGIFDAGGALYGVDPMADPQVVGAQFARNRATNGGAVSADGIAAVMRSSFTRNRAEEFGGAMAVDDRDQQSFFYSGAFSVYSSFTRNRAVTGSGGAIAVEDAAGSVLVSGSSAIRNRADIKGGAIYSAGVEMFMLNSTITANRAGSEGGGIAAAPTADLQASFITLTANSAPVGGGVVGPGVAITNSIVNRNRATEAQTRDVVAEQFLESYSMFTSPTSVSVTSPWTPSAGTLFGAIPVVGAPENNGGLTTAGGASILTMKPLNGSPVIGTANPNPVVLPEFDQRGPGFPRVVMGQADMGAIEGSTQEESITLSGQRGSGNQARQVTISGRITGVYVDSVTVTLRVGTAAAQTFIVSIRDGGRFAIRQRTSERVVAVAEAAGLQSPRVRVQPLR